MDRPYTIFENPLIHRTGYEGMDFDEIVDDITEAEAEWAEVDEFVPSDRDPWSSPDSQHPESARILEYEDEENSYYDAKLDATDIVAAREAGALIGTAINYGDVGLQSEHVGYLAQGDDTISSYNIAIEAMISSLQTSRQRIRDFEHDNPGIALHRDETAPPRRLDDASSPETEIEELQGDVAMLQGWLAQLRSDRADLR